MEKVETSVTFEGNLLVERQKHGMVLCGGIIQGTYKYFDRRHIKSCTNKCSQTKVNTRT